MVIKLDDYSYQEFGMLEGRVESLNPSLNAKSYPGTVSLLNGLMSTYGRNLFLKRNGLSGNYYAGLRLIERIFYGLRRLFPQQYVTV